MRYSGRSIATAVLVIAAVLTLPALLAAVAAAPPSAPSPPAKAAPAPAHPEAAAALRRFEQVEQQAGRQLAQALDQARARLVKELTAVQEKLTKAGNLEEAVRVRDAIQLGKALAGTRWRKVAGPHKGFTIAFRPDMSLTTDHHATPGTWAPVAKDRLRISIQSSSCKSELLAVGPDGRVMVNADGEPDFEFLGR